MRCKWFIWLSNDAKLPVSNLEWIEDTSQFNKVFIKNYNEEFDRGYFLEVHVQYPEKLHKFHIDFYLRGWILKNIVYTHKKFETSIKSWINFEKNDIELLNLNKKLG